MYTNFDNRILAEFRRQRDTDDATKAAFLDMLMDARAEGCDVNELVDGVAEKLREGLG